ncbi:hypothetical protein [Allomuricauda sp. R78024]|uniref:hypothetical protein n=1 Tax=Allomuricauda sp. R78024 TaxID=3093867 RepID=UPI0037C947A5
MKDNLIIEFSLLVENNSNITANIEGIIDNQNNTISLTFSFDSVDFNFTPDVVVSENASITPNFNSSFDFSDELVFDVVSKFKLSVNNSSLVTTVYLRSLFRQLHLSCSFTMKMVRFQKYGLLKTPPI